MPELDFDGRGHEGNGGLFAIRGLQAHPGDRGFEEQDRNTVRWRIADGQTYGDSVSCRRRLHGAAASSHQDKTRQSECDSEASSHCWTSSLDCGSGRSRRSPSLARVVEEGCYIGTLLESTVHSTPGLFSFLDIVRLALLLSAH